MIFNPRGEVYGQEKNLNPNSLTLPTWDGRQGKVGEIKERGKYDEEISKKTSKEG